MTNPNGHSANGHKRAVLVARVSRLKQAEGYSLPTQIAAMRAYAVGHGFAVADEIEDTISGTVEMEARPGGARLYDLINRRAIDAVIFYTLDRVARDEDVVEFPLLKRDLKRAGIELHFCDTGQVDYSNIMGSMIDTFRAAGAADELKKIRERTMRGLHAKAAHGLWVGGGVPPFGYAKKGKQETARLVVHKAEAAIVRRIFAMFTGATGRPPMPLLAIACQLTAEQVPPPVRSNTPSITGGWWKETVRRIVKSRSYIGELAYGGTAIHLPHLALVDPETWRAAQARIERNKRLSKRNDKRRLYLLTGFIQCGCGRAISGKGGYYGCPNANNGHLIACREGKFTAPKADRLAWDWLSELLQDEVALKRGLRRKAERDAAQNVSKRERLATVRELAAEAERSLMGLVADLKALQDVREEARAAIRAQVRETSHQLDNLTAERDRLEAELERLELTPEAERRILAEAARVRAGMSRASFATKRFFLDRLGFTAVHRRDNSGRWLDCTCALDAKAVAIESQSPARRPSSGGRRGTGQKRGRQSARRC